MTLNQTPSAERIHIGIFGRRNAGKSSLINALAGQPVSIVSDHKGTTTDPVKKAMELLPLGPVVLTDTPGLDDTGELGILRIEKTQQILNTTDIALLVIDGLAGMTSEDLQILQQIQKKKIPFVIAVNKMDLAPSSPVLPDEISPEQILYVSAAVGTQIHELKELLAKQFHQTKKNRTIVGDLISPGDFVVLVVPIDKSAPKGRLILPQQQTIRDILDHGATAIAVRDSELLKTLQNLGRSPALVITDSQVFDTVSKIVPKEVPLTSFSILFARYKGNLELAAHGAQTLKQLKDGDHVLICEGCTHHRQCEDIGTVKLPRMLKQFTRKELLFTFTCGTDFPSDLSPYQVIIHCGGCTLTEKEMQYRLDCAKEQGIPITNYGIAIACMKGILERSMEVFIDRTTHD